MAPGPINPESKDHLSFPQFILSHIYILVQNLNKKNAKTAVSEVYSISEKYGQEVYSYFLFCLIDSIDLDEKGQREQNSAPILLQELSQSLEKLSNFGLVCQAFVQLDPKKQTNQLINRLVRQIKLSPIHSFLLASAFSFSSSSTLSSIGSAYIKEKLSESLKAATSKPQLSEEVLHLILSIVLTCTFIPKDNEEVKSFIKIVKSQQDEKSLLFLLDPLLNHSTFPILRQSSSEVAKKMTQKTRSQFSLLRLISDLGPSSCSNKNTLVEIITQLDTAKTLNEDQISKVIVMLCKSSGEEIQSWNMEVFMDAMYILKPELSANHILKGLDCEDLEIQDSRALDVIGAVMKKAGLSYLPKDFFTLTWKNKKSQASLLKAILLNRPELFNFNDTQLKFAIPSKLNFPASLVNQTWNCLDLVQTLVNLCEDKASEPISSQIFDSASKSYPEMVAISLSHFKIPETSFLKVTLASLVSSFVIGHSHSSSVLAKIWSTNKDIVVFSMIETYYRDPSTLSRLLDVTQDLKVLTQMLEVKPEFIFFSIDLAALASRREFLNLEIWLTEKIHQMGEVFIKGCLEFLSEKEVQAPMSSDKSVPISTETLSIFLRTLRNNLKYMPQDQREQFTQIYQACSQSHPNLNQVGDPQNPVIEAPFSEEVEDEANSYFEKIYSGVILIDDIVSLLNKFKNSTNKREQEVFACMIHNLFDEYQYLPRYPDKELLITGTLFGALIQHQLVSLLPLGVALRYVLEALRKPVGSKLFKFGVQALTQFKSRFGEWPQYFTHILQIPHLKQAHPDIVELIEKALYPDSQLKPDSKVAPSLMPVSPETLQEYQNVSKSPGEATEQKVHIIFNNLTQTNCEQKARELITIIKAEFIDWLSQYIVVKRASVEQNLHTLYADLLDYCKSKELEKGVIRETHASIKVLIYSEKNYAFYL